MGMILSFSLSVALAFAGNPIELWGSSMGLMEVVGPLTVMLVFCSFATDSITKHELVLCGYALVVGSALFGGLFFFKLAKEQIFVEKMIIFIMYYALFSAASSVGPIAKALYKLKMRKEEIK